MTMTRLPSRLAALAVVACAFAAPARGAVLTFSLSEEYTGADAPAGPGPWLTATFDDGGSAGSVSLTVTSHLTDAEFVDTLLLNLDPALDPSGLEFSPAYGVATVALGHNAFGAGGGSTFDVELDFAAAPSGSRFGAGDSVAYTITGIPTLTAKSFAYASNGGGPDLLIAAQVQGIGANAGGSGWVTVPEPSAAPVLLAALPVACRRRRAAAPKNSPRPA
jgi:hypothetical protein